jgi:hypothetical protein
MNAYRWGIGDRLGLVLGLALLLLLVSARQSSAQIRASERGSVSQTLDGTTITIDYSRPTARGRELFGTLVPWDVTWTPGANWATTLEANKDIRINGVDVAAGRYSVWMTPREGSWTLTLNDVPEYFHFQKPDPALGAYNIDVNPETAEHVEMLTWSFPTVSGDAAVLAMRWGSTKVPLQVMVQPTAAVTLAEEQRKPLLGAYALEVLPGIGYPTEADFRVREADDGTLRAWMSFPIHEGDELEFDLIPAGPDRFNPGLYRDGELFNIEIGVSFEFAGGERAESVIMRGIEGTAFATGARADSADRTR